jgi:hypothetical protein
MRLQGQIGRPDPASIEAVDNIGLAIGLNLRSVPVTTAPAQPVGDDDTA